MPETPAPITATFPAGTPGHPAEQHPAPARGALQVVGADLRRHPAGHLAHRGEQRQRPVGQPHGLVGDGRGARGDERVGALLRRREVQEGEQHLVGAQPVVLLRHRFLDLQHEPGGTPHLVGVGAIRAPAATNSSSGRPAPAPASRSSEHVVAAAGQLPHAGRGDRHPVLVVLDLARDADQHPVILPYPAPPDRALCQQVRDVGDLVDRAHHPAPVAAGDHARDAGVVERERQRPSDPQQVREPDVDHPGVRDDHRRLPTRVRRDDALERGVDPRGERRATSTLVGQQAGEHPLPRGRVEPGHLVHGHVVRGVGVVLAQVVDDLGLAAQRGGERRGRGRAPWRAGSCRGRRRRRRAPRRAARPAARPSSVSARVGRPAGDGPRPSRCGCAPAARAGRGRSCTRLSPGPRARARRGRRRATRSAARRVRRPARRRRPTARRWRSRRRPCSTPGRRAGAGAAPRTRRRAARPAAAARRSRTAAPIGVRHRGEVREQRPASASTQWSTSARGTTRVWPGAERVDRQEPDGAVVGPDEPAGQLAVDDLREHGAHQRPNGYPARDPPTLWRRMARSIATNTTVDRAELARVPPAPPPGDPADPADGRRLAGLAGHRRRRPGRAGSSSPPIRSGPRRRTSRGTGRPPCVALSDEFDGPWVQVDGPAELLTLPDAIEPLVEYFRCHRRRAPGLGRVPGRDDRAGQGPDPDHARHAGVRSPPAASRLGWPDVTADRAAAAGR